MTVRDDPTVWYGTGSPGAAGSLAPPGPLHPQGGPGVPAEASGQPLAAALARLAELAGRPPLIEGLLAIVAAAAAFTAASPALAAYRVPGAAWMLVAAAVIPTVIGFVAGRVLRLTAPASYALSAAGLVLVLLAFAGPHVQAVARGLTRGPVQMLTETLPLSGGRAAMSAVVVLEWVVAAATAEGLVRTAGRPRRAPLALVLPPSAYVAFFAAASSAPHRDHLGGPVLIVVLALASALWAQAGAGPVVQAPPAAVALETDDPEVRPPSPLRAPLIGVLWAGAAAVLLGSLAPQVPGLDRRSVALQRTPPTVAPTLTDPLGEMADLRDGDPQTPPFRELTVSLSQPSDGYLAMAYLDAYDGAQWQFVATFLPTGGRIPEPAGVPAVDGDVSQRIELAGTLPVPLLPALDRPTQVNGLDVVADPVTGMIAPRSIGSGQSYTVVSRTPEVALPGLSPADGLADPGGGSDTGVPPDTQADLATAERFLATVTGQRPAPTVAFMQAALAALQREKRVDPAQVSPPGGQGASTTTAGSPASSGAPGGGGTSLSAVLNAVTVDRSATPEQFATFYAMIARYLGVPARVVTGFRIAGSSAGRPVAPGTYQVSDRQAWAWVEIPVAGFGWVVCDPTPDATTAVSVPPPESVQAPTTTLPPKGATVVPRGADQGHPLAPPAHIPLPQAPPSRVGRYAVIAAAALLGLILVGGPGQASVRRRLRRRRRRAGGPPERAVGAWLELLDGVARAGLRPGTGATAREVAAEIGHHFGPELVAPALGVAAIADQAVFSTTRPVSPDQADRAWQLQGQVQRSVRSCLDIRQKLRAAVAVGSAPVRPSGPTR